MDVYGLSVPEVFRIDDLLDFSNEEICSSSKTTVDFDLNHHYQPPPTGNITAAASYYDALPNSADFTDKLYIPSDDVAELEWLSNFVEDSSNNFPSNSVAGTMYLNTSNTLILVLHCIANQEANVHVQPLQTLAGIPHSNTSPQTSKSPIKTYNTAETDHYHHLQCQRYLESAPTVHQRKRRSGVLAHWAQNLCAMHVVFDTNRAGWSRNIVQRQAQPSC